MKSVKSSSSFTKGEGEHAVYVAFWQCCNSAAIIKTEPNSFHVTLRAPATEPEQYGDKHAIPFLPPIDGGKYSSGHHATQSMNNAPDCKGKSEVFAPEHEWRRYDGPAGISNFGLWRHAAARA